MKLLGLIIAAVAARRWYIARGRLLADALVYSRHFAALAKAASELRTDPRPTADERLTAIGERWAETLRMLAASEGAAYSAPRGDA